MKKTFLLITVIGCSTLSYGQTGGKPATPKPSAPVLKTLTDSANYAMGYSFANFWKEQGRGKLNTALVIKAMDDVFGTNKDDSACYALGLSFAKFYKDQGVKTVNKSLVAKGINDVVITKKPLLTEATANSCMNSYMTKIQEQKSLVSIEEGNAFLAKNKMKPGVKTTASGLQYEVITEGTGEKPGKTDSVTCHYKGTLLNNPLPFDDSYSRGQPITFALNRVIPGWTEALQLMSVGSKYKLYIPYTLGYGAFDYGPIPGGSMLTFEVELLGVKKVTTPSTQAPSGNN